MRGVALMNKYFMLLQVLIFTGFLLLIFLNPQLQSLNKSIENSKKQYDKMKNDTDKMKNDIDKMKNDTDKIGNEIFKQPWLDAISSRNRYYIFAFLTLGFLPFLYLLCFIYSSSNLLVRNKLTLFDVFILEVTSGFEGFIIYIYTLFSQKQWYFYSVPLVYLFTFMKAENNVERIGFKKYLISALLMVWSFLYFAKTSIYWSIPFFLIIPILIMT
jgi:hypothetical protein